MRKKLFYIALVVISIMLSCCNTDYVECNFENRVESHQSSEKTAISQEEAISIAEKTLAKMFSATRYTQRVVGNIEIIDYGTRSDSTLDNSKYYIINFNDNNGFVIVGGDTRMDEIYAFSNEGNILLSDTLENKGLGMYLSSLPKKISTPNDIIIEPVTPTVYEIDVTPLLTSFVRNWDQFTYNKYVRQYCNNDIKTPVGCTVVATAQIMSHFKHPSSLSIKEGNTTNTYYFNWDDIVNGTGNFQDQIARLFYILGSKDYLNLTYSTSSSSGSYTSFANNCNITYLRSGYFSPASEWNDTTSSPGITYRRKCFNGPIAQRELKVHKRPIQLTGTADTPGSNHCWVIDGLSHIKKTDSSGKETYTYFYHFVWGNTNKCNGYYSYTGILEKGRFSSTSQDRAEDEPGYILGESYHDINMYYNFRKK